MNAKLRLSDFCNMDEFEKILSDWSITSDMSVVVEDNDNKYITERCGFSDYCKQIQTSKTGEAECRNSQEDRESIFSCRAGLCDFVLPITLPNGDEIARVVCGQVKFLNSKEPDFNEISRKYGLDEENLRSDYAKISEKSEEEIEAAKNLLISTVKSFVERNYDRWLNQNETKEDRTLSQITQILYAYNITLDLNSGKYSLITGTGLERLVEVYMKYTDYSLAQNEAGEFVHPGYQSQLKELLEIDNLKAVSKKIGHIDTVEYPVLYTDASDYEWHEVNVFSARDEQGNPVINILGRDVTEAHNIQERNNREIKAAATRNQILSDLTKMLYSYNITLNLNTGKFTLIEGTGMTKFMEIFKSTDDYNLAYTEKIKHILPEYVEQFAAIAGIEALRGHRSSHGFIGNLEYGVGAGEADEWHEVNVFISSDEMGNPIANILGRDITEAHRRQEQRELSQKAAAARDQLLSGVTKMPYSFNVTVNLNSWKYSLITGTGCEAALEIMQSSDDYVLIYNKIRSIVNEESKAIIDDLCGASALNEFRSRSGFIGTVTTAADTKNGRSWQEVNLFMGTNEYCEPIANILGRDITESHHRQEEKENELKASAAKDQILSEITKTLYSYNLTVDLVTGKYSLITGTGMDETVAFLMTTDDYNEALAYELKAILPEYTENVKALMDFENLCKKDELSGHIGQMEYAAEGKNGTEWREVNVFISVTENGNAVANILGRDITAAHEQQVNRERELKAQSARDQLLSGITKMLYSYNMTVNVNTGKYTLITGTGLDDTIKLMQENDNYEVVIEHFTKNAVPEYLDEGLEFLSLENYKNAQSGYIDSKEFPEIKGDTIEWHEINIFAGVDDDGNPIINLLGRDVTEAHDRADTKAQLEIAEEASKAKSQFLFNMSHDIRTPMNAIIGFTELLQKHIDDKEVAVSYLEKIKSSNEFLLSLINNVLEMARIESGKTTLDESYYDAYAFNDTLCAVFDSQMQEKGIEFTRSINVEHSDVVFDGTKLREIFLNILSNALKYTPTGGKVTMTTVEIPSTMPGYVMYKTVIADTGIGMSKEFLPHLFEEFAREKNSTESKIIGTGLGMPIVKNLIELMQGSIEVESELGKGTAFTVVIPHRLAEKGFGKEQLEQEKVVENLSFEGKRILLAEDNDLNAEIAEEILEDAGFEVERAEDGVVCVSMLEQADKGYYDLILMDIQMPNLDGYGATKRIRMFEDKEKANIPIIAMTANAFDEDKKNAFAAGMNGHLSKPIEIQKLLETLAEILNMEEITEK